MLAGCQSLVCMWSNFENGYCTDEIFTIERVSKVQTQYSRLNVLSENEYIFNKGSMVSLFSLSPSNLSI